MPLVQQFGMDPTHPLSTKLDAKQKEKLAAFATQYGLAIQKLEPMRPWLADLMMSVVLLKKAGFDEKAGVDRVLLKRAQEQGAAIRGFETLENQLRFCADMPENEQIEMLDQTLDEGAKGTELFDKLATAWAAGDVDTLSQLMVDEMKTKQPHAYEKLIVQRNIDWSKKIEEMLKGSGVQEIAVGAGHLVGPDSVQQQLAKRSIKAERY